MVARLMRPLMWIVVAALAGCGGDDEPGRSPDAAVEPIVPTANLTREVVDTKLSIDVTQLHGSATIKLAASAQPGASLEVGDLTILDVQRAGGGNVPYAVTGKQLDLGVPADTDVEITIAYQYKLHEKFDGASTKGFTFLWPYYCGNLFPCHSQPSDGATFTLDIAGVPAGKTAVFAPAIAQEAPSYQVAWAIGEYTQLDLGTTTAGTKLSVWHLPNEAQTATNGTQNLVAAFDWLEKTIGPYRFGSHAGTVSVPWGAGAYGGMEHHPRWHVGTSSLASQETNIHEAAHGWFGDGIRITCWEDFVLSEGTTTYLAARALDVVAPTVGAQTWTSYETELGGIPGADPVWPPSCGSIDILDDNLFTNAPYIRGAFFYRGVALKVGAAKLDEALAAFYAAHAGRSATMTDMLDTIKAVTGYDATTCAQSWLRSTVRPSPGPCP
jgi:aminopeptidase N